MTSYPVISFIESTDEYDLQMADMKGLFAFDVKISERRTIRVCFIKLSSFEEDVRMAEERGECYMPNENDVILSELTKEKMYNAIQYLFDSGYLERLPEEKT